MHNNQKGFPGSLFKNMKRNWNKTTYKEPCIHESVFHWRQKNNKRAVLQLIHLVFWSTLINKIHVLNPGKNLTFCGILACFT